MLQTTCPACQASITLFDVLRAPTPFHLKCRQCQARLRTHRLLEWAALALALVGGVVVGHRLIVEGFRAVLPLFIVVFMLELAAAVAIVTVCKLEARN